MIIIAQHLCFLGGRYLFEEEEQKHHDDGTEHSVDEEAPFVPNTVVDKARDYWCKEVAVG